MRFDGDSPELEGASHVGDGGEMTNPADIAARAMLEIDVPWDDLRAARVH